MKPTHGILFIVLLSCAGALGQSAPPPSQQAGAQVHGTIKDPTGAPFSGIKVKFLGEIKKIATTNGAGEYEAELPPGLYMMDVSVSGFRRYHRPWFSVTPQANLMFDITMQLTSTCDVEIVSSSGDPAPTEEQKSAVEEACLREELLPVPQKKGVAFPLFVQYGKRTLLGDVYKYFEGQPNTDPVFVAYNLFALEADHVTYDARTQVLDAHDHVVVVDESNNESKLRTGDWMKFKLEDGQPTLQGCVCNQFPKKYTRGRLFHQNP
ncbi:MAG TPA: carboxypeptidase-like regulatory domain-containing protein [Candidatus Dormibacteraeota bacterium]|nr:carboxypeptidase-like regulatory domain-containing protein [Candidatus Dormibacteraeota bacterium]